MLNKTVIFLFFTQSGSFSEESKGVHIQIFKNPFNLSNKAIFGFPTTKLEQETNIIRTY